MSSLRELNLRFRYRSGRDDLVGAFFDPALESSVLYQRAAGYFSSSALITLGRGLSGLLRNGGRMQLIASPHLSEDDATAIATGYDRRKVAIQASRREIENAPWCTGVEALAWLIAEGRLDIRLALRPSSEYRDVLYHEKMGVLWDSAGDFVAFSGSLNESQAGLQGNFESFDVDFSWNDVKRLAEEKAEEFAALWDNRTEGVETIDCRDPLAPVLISRCRYHTKEEFLCSLLHAREETPTGEVRSAATTYGTPSVPRHLVLFRHQKEAIKAWFSANCQAILKMATGSGKTIAALTALTKLVEFTRKNGRSLIVVVVVPYRHLVEQWDREARAFGFHPTMCFESVHSWIADAQALVLSANINQGEHGFLLVTNATFRMPPFQAILASIHADLALVVDECHNAGARSFCVLLPESSTYRLGLSATPERHHDDEGTGALQRYFGPVVFEFGLAEALRTGTLCPYDYHPHTVDLTGDEAHDYIELSRRIGIAWQKSGGDVEEDADLQNLLIRRARITANASNKLPLLFELLQKHRYDSHVLVYCGDGRSANPSNLADDCRQVEQIVKVLGTQLGYRCHKFTAEESTQEREDLIRRFASGELQVLVAIRCLDEGFDVPSTETAFILASSSNPRQFIQRRGRVLRQSRATGKKKATIHDLVVLPPSSEDQSLEFSASYSTERSLMRKELMRISEFASLAMNGAEAMQSLASLREHYGLVHI